MQHVLGSDERLVLVVVLELVQELGLLYEAIALHLLACPREGAPRYRVAAAVWVAFDHLVGLLELYLIYPVLLIVLTDRARQRGRRQCMEAGFVLHVLHKRDGVFRFVPLLLCCQRRL